MFRLKLYLRVSHHQW